MEPRRRNPYRQGRARRPLPRRHANVPADFAMVYRPTVTVSRSGGGWKVDFDWFDTFVGYEANRDFVEGRMPDDDELYRAAEDADSWFEGYIGQHLPF